MTRNIRVMMQDTRIVFEDEQCGVHEEIYDFMSALRNVSAFPLQKQLNLLIDFMQSRQRMNTPVNVQMIYMMLVGMVYDYLEPISKATNILHIGDDGFDKFLECAAVSFHEKNRLYIIGNKQKAAGYERAVVSYTDDLLRELQSFRTDYFQMVMYRVRTGEENFGKIYKELSRMLSDDAIIILYGYDQCPEDVVQICRYTPGKLFDFEEMGYVIYLKPEKICEQSLEYKETIGQTKRLNESLKREIDALWDAGKVDKSAMEKALRRNMDLEKFVNEQRDIFRNENIKYYCNEVKNAIMDLYYEVSVQGKETIYFYNQIKQCQGEWETQIY